jgi:hypothetical protein
VACQEPCNPHTLCAALLQVAISRSNFSSNSAGTGGAVGVWATAQVRTNYSTTVITDAARFKALVEAYCQPGCCNAIMVTAVRGFYLDFCRTSAMLF